ncbi:hypothetical protein [Sphingomonas sp. MMS24-J13]|uniref:hypothetical protein n=1 Tax=Sphingomonas sp. MMS24-J13 TaxID=3238686 RepID=UPI0038502851
MSLAVEPIYLVIRDAALRSTLSARLGLAGHSIVALQDLDTLIASRPASNGLFVIEGVLLPTDRRDWIDVLDPVAPSERCIVLATGEGGRQGPFMQIDRRGALTAIQDAIARMEATQPDG